DTEQAFPSDVCVHELFEAQAARTPEALAVTFEGVSLTYRELNEQAEQLAVYLQRLGVGPDVLVGVYMERSLDLIVSFLGIWKAGGAYVPLDPFNPSQRLLHMVEDSGAKIILTQRHLQGKLEVAEDIAIISMDEVNREGLLDEYGSVPILERKVQPHHLAYVIYTSGSTGRPKGVMVEHKSVVNHMYWMYTQFHLDSTERVLFRTSISFDPSVLELLLPFITGGLLIVAHPQVNEDLDDLVSTIQENKVTTLQLVPSLLGLLLENNSFLRCHSLRRVFCGGEAMTIALQNKFFSQMNTELYNLYGPTEGTIDTTFWSCDPEHQKRTVPIGKAISNIKTYILDKNLQPVPIGVSGQLYIGGDGLARGYRNPDLNAERFISIPLSSHVLGETLYYTGDLVRYASDGNIEYIGRIDHQVKINGVRMELGEIATVLHSHDQVKEAIVIVREDEYIGKQLIAYVVVDEQQEHMDHILQHYMTEQLPQVMVPSVYVFLDALPLNANGKVDRKALPVPDTYVAEEQVVHPSTSIEKTVARACQELLGTNNISMSDNFFKLGGHSLLAAQFISRLRKTLDVEIALRTVLDTTTLAALA
ncbi:non-ribosomal peptide synthetase, partial [Chengkuizengella marina]